MSKISFPIALAAGAIAIPLAQKATATEIQNPLDYVKLATPVGSGDKTTWLSPRIPEDAVVEVASTTPASVPGDSARWVGENAKSTFPSSLSISWTRR